MIDANSQFFAILTNVGMAKQANADALGVPWKLTHMGVGDANGTDPIPNATQTSLIREWRRQPLNQLRVDPVNPAVIIAEQIIPADEGGFWIREIGLYDADGDLVAVANCAPSFKPVLSQGSGRTQVVRMNFIVASTGNITLKIDPAVVLATREYVDTRIMEELYKLDSKQSVRAATTANIALAGLQTVDGVVLVAGDRVLVKNQTTAKGNGLYIAASGAWGRAADADANLEVTPSLTVVVEQGTTQADTLWQMVTDGPIVLGTTALTFQNITFGFAPLASPTFTGAPKAPTAAPGTNNTQIATTSFALEASVASGVGRNKDLRDTVFEKGIPSDLYGTGTWFGFARGGPDGLSIPFFGVVTGIYGTLRVDVPYVDVTGRNGYYRTFESSGRVFFQYAVSASAWGPWQEFYHSGNLSDAFVSPALTGTPTVPTAAPGTNTTQIASAAFVQAAIAALVASSPAALDTLNELAVALGNDPNFATTMTNALAAKAPRASPALTGAPTAPTPSRFDATTKIATMAAIGAVGAQYNGMVFINGAGLTGVLAHVGGAVHFSGATGNSYSLPNSVTLGLPVGATVRIHNWGGSAMSVGAQGSDKMQEATNIVASATARTIPSDSYVDCIFIGSGTWLMFGTGVMGKTTPFGAGLGSGGYQRLPSGLIVQWGPTTAAQAGDVLTMLPIGFPSVFATVLVTQGYTAGTGTTGSIAGGVTSLGSFTWRGTSVGNSGFFIAIGY